MASTGRHLVARFALSTLLAFVVVGTVLSLVFSRQVGHRAQELATEHARFLATSVLPDQLTAEDLAQPFAATDARYQALLAFVRTRILGIEVTIVRIKIWRSDGTILFSDEPRLLGQRFDVDEDLIEAFKGEAASELSDLEASENVYERGLAPKLFATYLPFYPTDRAPIGPPPAVVEVYTDLHAATSDVNRSFRLVGPALLGGLALIYVAQLPIARRMGKALREQNARLGRLLREEQQRVDELRELNRLKGEFVDVASHELRTPLTTILGYAKTLRRPEFSQDEAARDEFLEAIERQGDRLTRLLENLLAVSSSEKGPRPAQRKLVSFEIVLDDVERGLGEQANRIRRRVDGDLPLLETDPDLLALVLDNLIDNALKFSPPDRSCEVRARREAATLIFWVRDEGMGVAPEDIPRIFDRFYQVDSSSTRRHGGVGLGLSLVRRSVDELGGDIRGASEPGEGSTFTVTMPAFRDVSPDGVPASDQPEDVLPPKATAGTATAAYPSRSTP
jgi:signal transduction histidine kinase